MLKIELKMKLNEKTKTGNKKDPEPEKQFNANLIITIGSPKYNICLMIKILEARNSPFLSKIMRERKSYNKNKINILILLTANSKRMCFSHLLNRESKCTFLSVSPFLSLWCMNSL